MQPNTITIYTDGSSKGNPGPGGWAAVISDGEKVVEIGGREEHTTNNRMELTAAIKALEFVGAGGIRGGLPEESPSVSASSIRVSPPSGLTINIFTDSSYVAKGASEWLAGWQKKGWKNSQKQEVLNRDLWEKIAELLEKFRQEGRVKESHELSEAKRSASPSLRPATITWKIIPGHSGIAGNERCDVIATSFADNAPVKLSS